MQIPRPSPRLFRQHTGSALVIMGTGSKLLHVIARSEATGQSVTPAVAHSEREYFGRIRKSSGFA